MRYTCANHLHYTSGWSYKGIKYPLISKGISLVIAFITVALFFGWKYSPGYILDDEGITSYTKAGQAKRNRKANLLLIVLGAASGKTGMVGTGLMARSMETGHQAQKVRNGLCRTGNNPDG